jgi:hypothetical protein
MIATGEPEYELTAGEVLLGLSAGEALLALGNEGYRYGNPRALVLIEWALQWAERRGYGRSARFESAFRGHPDAGAFYREVRAVLDVLDPDEFLLRLADRMNAMDGESRRQRPLTTTH